MENTNISSHDLDTLRRLAARKRAISDNPVNKERRRAWYALDAGKGDRVMVLAEHGGIRDKSLPVPNDILECTDEWARGIENNLRAEIYQFEILKDDHVVEPFINLNWQVTCGDYGMQPVFHQADNDGHLGAKSWDPPVKDLDKDLDKLHPRTFTVDREKTFAEKERLEIVFDGKLNIRIRGSFYWTMGLTGRAIELIGLENLMLFMFDNPEGLRRLMTFLRDDHVAFAQWLEKEELYTLNNENDYIGSGSMGYTRDLPTEKASSGTQVKMKDLWVLLESQETVGVGPDQFEQFVFPYQLSIAERFGKTYYGCCEPVHNRWHILKRIPNLARVSVSPWADQEFMAHVLKRNYVFSRKPNPTLISTGRYDEEMIRTDIRKTLCAAQGCRLELIMKDVHTLQNEPERLPRWVEIARQEIEKHA